MKLLKKIKDLHCRNKRMIETGAKIGIVTQNENYQMLISRREHFLLQRKLIQNKLKYL